MNKLSVPLTKTETATGWIYWAFQMFLLPLILAFMNRIIPKPLSEAKINFLFFGINFIFVTVILRHFLITSLKNMLKRPFFVLRFAFFGLLLYFLLNVVVNVAVGYIKPDFINQNDATLKSFYQENYAILGIGTVLLVPTVEESFYRGLVFQGLHKKSRILAYVVSVTVFSLIHIVGYIGVYDPLSFLLSFMQYLPAGIALAWAYEKADNIVAPILIHTTVNQIAISAMR